MEDRLDVTVDVIDEVIDVEIVDVGVVVVDVVTEVLWVVVFENVAVVVLVELGVDV